MNNSFGKEIDLKLHQIVETTKSFLSVQGCGRRFLF